MSLTCPRCGWISPHGTTKCECGQVLTAADTTPEAAPKTSTAQPASAAKPGHCPFCHGPNVRLDGWANMDTHIQFGSKWTGPGNAGYLLNCLACMDCGYVGYYLGPDDVQRLRAQPITSNAPVRKGTKSGCAGVLLLVIVLAVMAGVALAGG